MLQSTSSNILRVLKHKSVIDSIYDDGCNTNGDLGITEILRNPRIHVLTPDSNSVFIFTPRNTITYEVHVAILPESRRQGRDLGKTCFSWMFENTKCRKIVASVPAFNRLCLMYARSNGMKPEGVTTKSFQLNGELFDMYNFGITESEFYEEVLLCRQ